MRIAFDIAALGRGGAERQTLEIVSGLSSIGHEVLLIVNKRAEQYAEYFDRVRIVELGCMSRWDVRVLPAIRHTLKTFGPDVCVCVSFNASLWGRIAAASLGCPVIVAEHSTTTRANPLVRFTNICLRGLTESVIACANGQRESLVRAGHQQRKIRVVHNGVSVARFSGDSGGGLRLRQELGVPADAAVVMLVAAHRPEKRHDRFIALIEGLHDLGIDAWGLMVGSGPLIDKTTSLAQSSRVAARLRVAGPVEDMPAAYSAADVVVLLSDNVETFPLSFLEAQACGVPVVGMNIGGVGETLIHGGTGLVVKQGDMRGMVSAVAALLSNPSQREAMGTAGRAFVEAQLSTEAMIGGYERVLTARCRN